MPHIKIKAYPLTEETKQKLAAEISKVFQSVAGNSEAAISIDIEEVPASEWMEKVYEPEIRPNLDRLYKKPGY